MSSLYEDITVKSQYVDNKFLARGGTREEYQKLLEKSCTLYVGNLSFYTREEQIHEIFRKCGDIKRIILGLDRVKKTPCGFSFVEYYSRVDAEDCVKYLNGTNIDGRPIRVDWDWGFEEGRQYGRGKSGCQVRDEVRRGEDPDRPVPETQRAHYRDEYPRRPYGRGGMRRPPYAPHFSYYQHDTRPRKRDREYLEGEEDRNWKRQRTETAQ